MQHAAVASDKQTAMAMATDLGVHLPDSRRGWEIWQMPCLTSMPLSRRTSAAFDKPGVLSVRPGFKVKNDWLTNTQAVVVTVRHKVAHPAQGEMLPAEVGGVAVDVRQASPEKALELEDPHKYTAGLRLAPNLGSVPHFPEERTLAGTRPAAAASAHAQLAAIPKPELTYGGPPGVTLIRSRRRRRSRSAPAPTPAGRRSRPSWPAPRKRSPSACTTSPRPTWRRPSRPAWPGRS